MTYFQKISSCIMYNASPICAFIDFNNKHVRNMCDNWYHVDIEHCIEASSHKASGRSESPSLAFATKSYQTELNLNSARVFWVRYF